MIHIINRTWEYLNGKKTVIGTVLAAVYGGLLYIGVIDRVPEVEFIITTVLGVGLGHKVVKSA